MKQVDSETLRLPPSIIKYMGSKRELIDFIVTAVKENHAGEMICDLFAGTGVVGAVLQNDAQIWSNDIQEYSEILARTYMGSIDSSRYVDLGNDILKIALSHVETLRSTTNVPADLYDQEFTLKEFNEIEERQQGLINESFRNDKFYLFTQNYSGTYWSCEQCMWIDGIRFAASKYQDQTVFNLVLASLMHAMAYNAQSTGHYAQYRDANKAESMADILLYRRKAIWPYFSRKLSQLLSFSELKSQEHKFTSLDYKDCLTQLPSGTLVYADPPYAFVHYSRFYHALETLVKYDYPVVKHKGRYRDDRHQSPFCQKTNVKRAFQEMFEIIARKEMKLVLSYSDTGMIALNDLIELAKDATNNYDVMLKSRDYVHSTMGRSEDKSRDVQEILLILKPQTNHA